MRLQGTWLLWLMVVVGWWPELPAAEVWLKNGMRLEGQLGGPIPEIGGDPLTGQAKPGQLIMVLDDGLRRTFFSVHQQDRVSPDVSIPRKIEIDQRVASGGAAISSVGQILEATPFDAWGRRRLRLVTPRDVVDVVQGITEITPVYTKVEGLVAYRATSGTCDWPRPRSPKRRSVRYCISRSTRQTPTIDWPSWRSIYSPSDTRTRWRS